MRRGSNPRPELWEGCDLKSLLFIRGFLLLEGKVHFLREILEPDYICAQFCAHPISKSVTLGSNGAGEQIARNGAENQHDSKSSHSVGKTSAATVNRRVASSNLARGANLFLKLRTSLPPRIRWIRSTVGSSVGDCLGLNRLAIPRVCSTSLLFRRRLSSGKWARGNRRVLSRVFRESATARIVASLRVHVHR